MFSRVRSYIGLRSAFLAAVPALLALPVVAQDDVDAFVLPAFNGVAVAQAPEAGMGVCFSPLMEDAASCAQRQCVAESGLGVEDCAVNLWCYPAGWVADLFMQHVEGAHWHKVICDQQDLASLEAVIAVECAREYLVNCQAVRVWDADGVLVVGEGAVHQPTEADILPQEQ